MSYLKYIERTGYSQELISAHTHLILVGSVMMMIMGVALWFFPRAEKEDKKYSPDLILATYWVMTIGTGARFIFQVIASIGQTATHFTELSPAHSVQSSGTMKKCSSDNGSSVFPLPVAIGSPGGSIASTGHSTAQAPQLMQFSSIYIIRIFLPWPRGTDSRPDGCAPTWSKRTVSYQLPEVQS